MIYASSCDIGFYRTYAYICYSTGLYKKCVIKIEIFSKPKDALSAQKNRLIETVILRTRNICFKKLMGKKILNFKAENECLLSYTCAIQGEGAGGPDPSLEKSLKYRVS